MSRRTIYTMLLLAGLPCIALVPSCSRTPPVWPDKPGKKVLATFTPIYCFAQTIAGDDANVLCLLTANDPHDTETLTTRDVRKVRDADLVLANGLKLEDQLLPKIIRSTGKKIAVLNVGDGLGEKMLLHSDRDHDDHGDEKDHKHGDHDPHVWLGPDRAKKMVDIIAERLGQLDPSKKDKFDGRAREFKAELDKLKKYGLDKFGGKKIKIVAHHGSLGYFADEFNLEIVGQIRTQGGDDQGANKELFNKCKKERPSVIMHEPQYNEKEVHMVRDTLKKEGIETKLVAFDPLETAKNIDGSGNPPASYYLDRMRENIDNLAQALK